MLRLGFPAAAAVRAQTFQHDKQYEHYLLSTYTMTDTRVPKYARYTRFTQNFFKKKKNIQKINK